MSTNEMHHRLVKIRERKQTQETEQLDDSDCSDTWSLPTWPELQQARLNRMKKLRRLRRLREKEERAKRREEQKNKAEADEAPIETSPSSTSVGSQSDDLEDDIPEDMKQRGRWNNSFEFLLSIISMSVGMGNFYRFPFVAYQNGGGAFLIPYVLVLTFVGRPMYLLELAIGQFCSFGQVKVWEISPFFRGVGYGSAIGSFCWVTYCSSVMAVTFYYLFMSFQKQLPWTFCNPEWAGRNVCQHVLNVTRHNKSLEARQVVNLPQLYFDNQVTKGKNSIDDGIGIPLLMPSVCLLVTWVVIYLMIARGVESSGKSAYFTTIYPFVVIVLMLIVACTKPGAGTGMLYFITPQWGKMLDINVWFAAIGQCFFSLGTGFGPIINYASFNPFHHSIYRDAMIVSVMDTTASFIAGLTIFATLGSMAHNMDKPISAVISGGPGLVFITFSDAISNFDYVPQLLSVMFFVMLLTIAGGSAVAWQMAAISVVCDEFPKLSRFWVTAASCVVGFLLSLIYATPGGQFLVTLVDNFGGNVNIYILGALECVGIIWVYGLKNFARDVEFMLNKKVSWYWKICWGFIIPPLLTSVMLYSIITGSRLTHNGHPFPNIAICCGWGITGLSLVTVPIFAVYAVYKEKGTFKERFLTALRPTEEFGPRNPSDKERWILFKKGIIAMGGPAPDTYQLPEGETASNNDLPDWLTVLEDNQVLPTKVVNKDPELQALRRPEKYNEESEQPSDNQSVDSDENG